MADVEARLAAIEERNRKVEHDKAWETSLTRRGLICAVTYVCAFTFLTLIGNEGAAINAIVPVLGYVLSTLSLPLIKAAWIRRRGSHA